MRYDAAGNLLFDGHFVFQYDAWNRLLQVNAGHLSVETPPQVVVDGLVKHHSYDGLGRLACTQSPVAGGLRTERFYYDGIRRLQEVVTDPLDGDADAAMAGDPGALAALAAEPGLDGDAASAPSQASQAQAPAPPTTGLVREYVWGPGDNGVDELLAQYDAGRAPTYALQDAGLDIIALADLGGSAGSARVAWQTVYDAYGSVLAAESLYAHAPLHAGHKGLFFDRLDAPLLDPLTGLETPRLAPDPGAVRLLGHVRNRAYLPHLGRWAQKDPNASGQDVVEATAFGGAWLGGAPIPFGLSEMLGDGANLYSYVGANPWAGSDPLGLYFDDLLIMGYDTAKAASALIGNYAFDMTLDLDWASDWGAGDWEQSRFSTPGFDTISEDEIGGPMQAGLINIVVRGTAAGARTAVGLMDNVARALYDLHHIIPKFLGGLEEGSLYVLKRAKHRGDLHREIGALAKRILGQHPNARAGTEGILSLLDSVDFTKIIEFRQELYNVLRRFDADNGTALLSAFRREFAQQRMVKGYVKIFK